MRTVAGERTAIPLVYPVRLLRYPTRLASAVTGGPVKDIHILRIPNFAAPHVIAYGTARGRYPLRGGDWPPVMRR